MEKKVFDIINCVVSFIDENNISDDDDKVEIPKEDINNS